MKQVRLVQGRQQPVFRGEFSFTCRDDGDGRNHFALPDRRLENRAVLRELHPAVLVFNALDGNHFESPAPGATRAPAGRLVHGISTPKSSSRARPDKPRCGHIDSVPG